MIDVRLDIEMQGRVIDSLVLRGDISLLSAQDRARYYIEYCQQLGLNPASNPLAILKLNGKEVLYPTRGATDQLAAIHRLTREIVDGPRVVDLAGTKLVYCVCRATHPNGRVETAVATVPLTDPANVLMKCETKAKRRATLSILGLGMLDESELDTIPASAKEPVPSINLGALEQAPTTLDKLSDQLKSAETLDAVCAVWIEHSTDIGEEDTGPDGESRGIAAKARKLVNARVVELGLAKSATAADKAVKARCLVLTQPKTQPPVEQQPTPAVGEEPVQQDYERSLRNCETLNEIAKLWIDKRTALKTLGEEMFAEFWEKTVSRADDFKATRAALKAAIKTLEGPPDGPGSKKSDGAVPASAQGTAAPAAVSDAPQAGLYLVPNDESAPYVASADEWRAHVAAYKHRENAINSWKKHCAAFRAAGERLYRDRLQTAAERFQALANAVDVEVCKVALLNAEREANNNARKHAEALRKAG